MNVSENKNDLKFIQSFSKIKISDACRFYGYNQSNVMQGKSGRRAERNIRKYIERELAKIRLEEMRDENE